MRSERESLDSPSSAVDAAKREFAPGFLEMGITAFCTTRAAGDFHLTRASVALESAERWRALGSELARNGRVRLACAHQVHADGILMHGAGWSGWLRGSSADGHFSEIDGTCMAVTLADCVPIFIAHPSGACAMLHSGWRGTELGIVRLGIERFRHRGFAPSDLVVFAGPAICGSCYEVSPDVFARLTGRTVESPTPVDLRGLIADQARAEGVRSIFVSDWCTRCHNDRFFSHRAGDAERQIGVIVSGRM